MTTSLKKLFAEHDFFKPCIIPKSRTGKNLGEETTDEIYDWIAENLVELFNSLYMVYSQLEEENDVWEDICISTEDNNGFPRGIRFVWTEIDDPTENAKPQQIQRADEYIVKVFIWISSLVENQDIFPHEGGTQFPADFLQFVKKAFRRMLRIYAIIYANDCLVYRDDPMVAKFGLKEFLYFSWFWKLIDMKEAQILLGGVFSEILRSYYSDVEKNQKRIKTSPVKKTEL